MELPLKTQIDRSERLTPAWIRPVFGRSDPDSDPKLAGWGGCLRPGSDLFLGSRILSGAGYI